MSEFSLIDGRMLSKMNQLKKLSQLLNPLANPTDKAIYLTQILRWAKKPVKTLKDKDFQEKVKTYVRTYCYLDPMGIGIGQMIHADKPEMLQLILASYPLQEKQFFARVFNDLEVRGPLEEALLAGKDECTRVLLDTLTGKGTDIFNMEKDSIMSLLLYRQLPVPDDIQTTMVAQFSEQAGARMLGYAADTKVRGNLGLARTIIKQFGDRPSFWERIDMNGKGADEIGKLKGKFFKTKMVQAIPLPTNRREDTHKAKL